MAIERVAVIGAGTMGAGIAQVCAQAGWKTALFDAFPDGLERGMQRIDAFWDKGIARGKTTAEQKQTWAANLRAESDMKTAVQDADLVIEAVPEIPELKASIFEQLDAMAPSHAILGTNTSQSQALQQQQTVATRSLECISSIQFQSWNSLNWFAMKEPVRKPLHWLKQLEKR